MKTFEVTDVGMKRSVNQDCVYCSENEVGMFPNLFIVADGMGGHQAGDMASKLCVSTAVESVENTTFNTPVTVLREAIEAAHKKVRELSESNADYYGMGTTLVMATITEEGLYVANVGDSRLYLLRDKLEQITEDHSLVEEMVKKGELAKDKARSHPNKNIITRALGIGLEVVPDFFHLEVREGDIILLCSDGLSNELSDDEIEYIIKNDPVNLEKTGMNLLNKANDAGGKDNITVLLVRV